MCLSPPGRPSLLSALPARVPSRQAVGRAGAVLCAPPGSAMWPVSSEGEARWPRGPARAWLHARARARAHIHTHASSAVCMTSSSHVATALASR